MPGPQPCRCRPFIFRIVGSGLDRSAGRRGRRPLQRRSVNLPLPYTPAGGYGIRPYAQTKPPCRGRACPARSLTVESPLTVCFVGRGLDPSATSRETAVNGISVGEGFIPPVYLPSPLTSAGRRGRRPLQRRSVNLPPPPTPRADRKSAPAHKQKPLPVCNHRQRLSIFQSSFRSRLIHTAGTSSSAPRPCWRPRPSCSQSQTRSLQCSRRSPSSRRDPCRGS